MVDKFVMEGLPPGQIKGAPSPTREGHQQPFSTRPVREGMRRSVEIRKCELCREPINQRSVSLSGWDADSYQSGPDVHCSGSAQGVSNRHQINASNMLDC